MNAPDRIARRGALPFSVPGLVLPDETAEVYHARHLDEANTGGLKIIAEKSPAHFRYWVEAPQDEEERTTFTFGRALHCAALEPDRFETDYRVLPVDAPRDLRHLRNAKTQGESTKESIAWWDAWDADRRTTLTLRDFDRLRYMGDSIRAHPVAAGMMAAGRRELTLRWWATDPETDDVLVDEAGLPLLCCKARLDLDDNDLEFILDLKSTTDASPDGFARSVGRYQYHLQEAHYLEGARRTGLGRRRFLFLACESQPPYVCAPYELDAAAEERGYQVRARALMRQAACLRAGLWPGYSDDLAELTLPGWVFA